MQYHIGLVCLLSCLPMLTLSLPYNRKHSYSPSKPATSFLNQRVPDSCPSTHQRQEVLRMVRSAAAPDSLDKHSQEFNEPRRIQVLPNVHVFIGYYLSNTIVIEAPDGLIVVDTGDCVSGAEKVIAHIRREVSQKVFKAVILTHNHPDHVGGTIAYQNTQPDVPIDVWGYEGLEEEFWKKWEYINPLLLARSIRQFGINLPAGAVKNAGLGIRLLVDKKSGLLVMPPDHFLTDNKMDVNIAGMDMTLMRIPGETNDQMGVYIPALQVFMIGDNYYKTFPNLYTIRGTPARQVEEWFQALDKVLELDVAYLVPSHTQPVIGKGAVKKHMTNYRDAIQFVFDQTIRLMNKGMHPEEIARSVKLPKSIKDEENLLEHYGMVEWSVKAVYDSKVGWFSGFPEDLFPLTPSELASKWTSLIPPHDLLHNAKVSLKHAKNPQIDTEEKMSDLKWAIHLSSLVWHSRQDPLITSDLEDRARDIRTQSLIELASLQTSPNARNYFLAWVLQENCERPVPAEAFTDMGTVTILPIDKVFRKLALLVKAELTEGVRTTCVVQFTDNNESWTLTLRNSILHVTKGDSKHYDLKFRLKESDFRNIILGQMPLASPGVSVVPSFKYGKLFLSYFDSPKETNF